MTTDKLDLAQDHDDDLGHLPDPLALALARALGRYQARRDMAAARDASAEHGPDPRPDRPTVLTGIRFIDLCSMSMPAAFLPGSPALSTAFRGGRTSLPPDCR